MCLTVISIAFLIGGIIAIVKGEISLSKSRKVTGPQARIIGAIMLLPLPLSFAMGIAYGVYLVAAGKELQDDDVIIAVVNVLPVLIVSIVVVVLGAKWGK